MWIDVPIFKEDIETICKIQYIDWDKMKDKTVLVTGGTGLIGSMLISTLLYADKQKNLSLKIKALVRNINKAKEQFAKQLQESIALDFIEGDVENLPTIEGKIDYIIHGACPTASEFFVKNPVETIKTSVLGTIKLLDLAKGKNVAGFVYLSSMEVYGKVESEETLREDSLGYINPLVVRSCYPESKRMCENICVAYAKEYNINVMSLRLAQTFGPGVAYHDKRVFAMMARCAMNSEDIVLQTKGTSRHAYLYTADAITAILCVLLRGEAGKAYNAANPETYCSIFEMGELVAKELASGKISVKIAENGDITKYPAPSFLNLNIDEICKLGWNANVNLIDIYKRMIQTMS